MIGRRVCCCTPPPPKCVTVCWRCAYGDSVADMLCLNYKTGIYTGSTGLFQGTKSGSTFLLQHKCNGIWNPSSGGISVPTNTPFFVYRGDPCCSCGVVYIDIVDPAVGSSLPTCGLACSQNTFGNNKMPADWDVPIGASMTNKNWNTCSAMADTYTVSSGASVLGTYCKWTFNTGLLGIVMPGQECGCAQPCGSFNGTLNPPCPSDPDNKCCTTNLWNAQCDGTGNCYTPGPQYFDNVGTCGLSLDLTFQEGPCSGKFVMIVKFGCISYAHSNDFSVCLFTTDCQGHATYESADFPPGSTVPGSVALNLQSGTADPACTGSLPGTITMTAA